MLLVCASTSLFNQTLPNSHLECDIDLAQLSEDLGIAAETLWGTDDTGFPTDPTELAQMHDELIASLAIRYPNPCQQQAIVVEVGEFFTSNDLNTLEERALPPIHI